MVNKETVAAAQVTAEQTEVAMSFVDKLQLYIAEIPVASILIGFVIFLLEVTFVQFVLRCHWSCCRFRNRFATVFNAHNYAFNVRSLCWVLTVMNDPHGTVAVVFSLIPLTSPIVMLMRIPFGVPMWQLALSVVLLYGTFIFVVWFAAKSTV